MAKISVELLSKNAYAKYLGINEKAVRNAVSSGKIKKGWDTENQKVIKHLADKEFGHLHQVAKPRPGVSSDKLAAKIDRQNKSEVSAKSSDKSEVKKEIIKSPNKSDKTDEQEDYDDEAIDPELSIDELIKRIKITSKLSYGEASRIREIIQLARDKTNLEEQYGSLVRKVDVDRVLYLAGTELKKSLMSMPQRCADELVHSNNKVDVINIIARELTEILANFSGFDNLNLKQ